MSLETAPQTQIKYVLCATLKLSTLLYKQALASQKL